MPDEGAPAGPPSRGLTPLQKNQALEEWLRWQLGQVQARIRDLKALEERERQARGTLWKVQPERPGSPALLHRGDCRLHDGTMTFISREDAVVALTMPEIEPCTVCRPETGLDPE
ncbi:DUF6233 domain-containing protein [Streptomyces parvus]|uniref:Uncharacterized protein n=1 Tax=Streptomyces parvus TaxID=66428 RepID=A0A7K3RRV3_9ACTN|nr:hypothetical protein [Streptomyces parvus]